MTTRLAVAARKPASRRCAPRHLAALSDDPLFWAHGAESVGARAATPFSMEWPRSYLHHRINFLDHAFRAAKVVAIVIVWFGW